MPLAARFLKPGGVTRLAEPDEDACSIEVCGVIAYCQGWCHRHYYRWLRTGDPLAFKVVQRFDRYNAAGERWCTRCKEYLAPDQFSANKTWCTTCLAASRYGLTRKQYAELLTGICPLCLTRPREVVDHDHNCCPGRITCGKCIRGGLCRQCNSAIGTLTEEGIMRAVQYLTRPLVVAA